MKECPTCGERKSLDSFYAHPGTADGRNTYCKACAKQRTWTYRLRRDFGLTPEDYQDLLTTQGGRCAICRAEPGNRKLDVDHCHATGKVRGLLCNPCNQGIGGLGDTVEAVRAALVYLEGAS